MCGRETGGTEKNKWNDDISRRHMEFIPKKYQELSLEFMRQHDRCALFLDMGLGKTSVSLTRVKELMDDFAVDKTLVIAPKRVAEDTWSRECAKWDHLKDIKIGKVLGTAKQREQALNGKYDIYVINRENVLWLIDYLDGKWPFDCVIIDELSSFKSPSAKRFRMLRRVISLSTYVYGLTGTPASNGYLDLWSEIFLIDSGAALGKTLSAYRNKYFSAGAHKGYIVYDWHLKHGAKFEIDNRLADCCISMSKEDWLSLPPIIYNEVEVSMTPSEYKVYSEFHRDRILPLLSGKISQIEDMSSAVVGDTAAVLSNKLLQMANGAVYDDEKGIFQLHDQKLDALEEIIEDANGQSVLVFYSYKHDLDRLKKRFPKAVKLETSEDITKWNEGKIPILLCHPAGAGHGLNLQEGGHIIVWFGLPWSLELYQQANARLYRQGQESSVIVHHIICKDTLDTNVLKALQGKNATQKSLLDALKNYVEEI